MTIARLVEVATHEGLARFASASRARICDAVSCLGLFVHRSMLDRSDLCPELDAIRALGERARRLASSWPSELDPGVRGLLERVPAREPATIVKTWLDLEASEVLFIPRPGALARRAAFDDELRRLSTHASLHP